MGTNKMPRAILIRVAIPPLWLPSVGQAVVGVRRMEKTWLQGSGSSRARTSGREIDPPVRYRAPIDWNSQEPR